VGEVFELGEDWLTGRSTQGGDGLGVLVDDKKGLGVGGDGSMAEAEEVFGLSDGGVDPPEGKVNYFVFSQPIFQIWPKGLEDVFVVGRLGTETPNLLITIVFFPVIHLQAYFIPIGQVSQVWRWLEAPAC